MKQPDPPDVPPQPPSSALPAQKASRRSVLSKAQQCALLVASVEWFGAGCTGVQTRPDPEPCPKEAIKAMKELGWHIHADGPLIDKDVTKPPLEQGYTAVFKDGPVTGATVNAFGKAPAGMRIDGHLWTTGDKIYGRYVRAHLPDERTVPICLELYDGRSEPGLGEAKAEGSKPGHTVGDKQSYTYVVDAFR